MRVRRAFTIIELLVVVSIIALLVGILLPAVGKARDQARLTLSQTNLRNLSAAHQTYAAEWNDRQFTLIVDTIASYGNTAQTAFHAYQAANGNIAHAPIFLGWGYGAPPNGQYGNWRYPLDDSSAAAGNYGLAQPIVFAASYFGSFRLPNVAAFNSYVSGRFYDKIFYAPKDTAVQKAVEDCYDDPGQISFLAKLRTDLGDIFGWSSYCLSPAAMFNPGVMQHDDQDDPTANGWRSPWSLDGGFRSPSFSQARYPNLKSHMLEHHWLQNRQVDCNASFEPGTYDGCEPYYFNHAWVSAPVTLFYDGHVGQIGTREAMRADGRMRAQTGQGTWGLWSKDTPFAADGYLQEFGYDQAATSYHVLTTDGILGRDVTAQ